MIYDEQPVGLRYADAHFYNLPLDTYTVIAKHPHRSHAGSRTQTKRRREKDPAIRATKAMYLAEAATTLARLEMEEVHRQALVKESD